MKAMNRNRYFYFDEGILPISNHRNYILYLIVRTSIYLAFIFLMIIPRVALTSATKYETAYACESKILTLECEPGDLISLIRANYGRFSITICNDHGNVEWSVNCRSSKSLRVLNLKCAHKQNCSVLASTAMFGDPCPGTHKYLEAHYQCISATLTLTTTTRPSPSWLITQQPPPSVHNGLTAVTTVRTAIESGSAAGSFSNSKLFGNAGHRHHVANNNTKSIVSVVGGVSSSIPKLQSTGANSEIHLAGRSPNGDFQTNSERDSILTTTIVSTTAINNRNENPNDNNRNYNVNVNHILGNHSYDLSNSDSYNASTNDLNQNTSIKSTELVNHNNNSFNNHNDNSENDDNASRTTSTNSTNIIGNIGSNSYCGPTTSRNLFWNKTRVGDVNVQQCPDGTNGIAKWRCIIMPRSALNHNLQYDLHSFFNRNSYINKKSNYISNIDENNEYGSSLNEKHNSNNLNKSSNDGSLYNNDCDNDNNNNNNNNNKNNGDCDKRTNTFKLVDGINYNKNKTLSINSINNDKDYLPMWHPQTPDLTHCRSVWFSNLENDVNKRDSSLVSIANDLSTVTSSKVLYGGDMLVTTKIIQTMSEKMPYDIETFPDQRQREAIISELLTGVVKIGSNLLDNSQQPSWLDLSYEDQMRVATSLLTGLESNAFLLADSITREKTATYPTKNILLSVRVLDSKNLPMNEVFPSDKNSEHWDISQDRIELPRGALYENSDGGLVRIIFVAFDRLESILRPSYEHLDYKIPSRNNVVQKSAESGDAQQNSMIQRVRILNSKVISASLGKGRHIQLSQPIKLVLKHLKIENVTNPTCVFWNYIDHAWSSDGCYLEATNRTHSVCMCNHLTNFAILMDVKEDNHKSLLSIFDNNLGIFIYISITICIIFIIIAILTLKLFNGAFIKSTRTSIYKNIYVCLFIIEILSLIGVKQNETSLLCGFTTAFLHCFVLSAIAWLFFEGFQLYLTLTTDDILLEVESSSKINWYYLLSYGLSFTIVAISLAIDPGTYTQSDFCVLMEANALFYSTFMTPIAIFVLGALTCTGLACYDMCRKNLSPIKNKEHTRLSTVRFDLRCSLLFLIILSADWVFAYLYLRRAKQDEFIAFTYGYLFVIFNSLLGIYIFIFHCIQNEKIRREYRKYIRQNSWLPKCLRCSKTSSIASSASQHHHPTQHHHLNQAHLQERHQQQTANSHQFETSTNMVEGGCTPIGGSLIGTPSHIGTNVAGTPTGRKYKPNDLTYASDIVDFSQIDNQNIGTLQRNSSGIIAGSMQANAVIRTPSAGHASPTSSVGSAQLIFNPKNLQQSQPNQGWNYSLRHPGGNISGAAGESNNKNLNMYDDKFLLYDCKSKRLKNHLPTATTPRNLSQLNKRSTNQTSGSVCNNAVVGSDILVNDMTNVMGGSVSTHNTFPYQQHEYFYWTEKNNSQQQTSSITRKQLNNATTGGGICDSIKGHNLYPSYKKTRQYSHQYYPTVGGTGRVYNKLSDCDYQLESESNVIIENNLQDGSIGITNSCSNAGNNKYYESASTTGYQRYQKPASHSSSKQQLSSDEDHCGGSDSVSSHHQLMPHNGLEGATGINNSIEGGNGPAANISGKFQSNVIVGSGLSGYQQQQHHHHHPHINYDVKLSNCDLVNEFQNSQKQLVGNIRGLDAYFDHLHHGINMLDEPVYEEILNGRMSERMSDHDADGDNDDDDDNDDAEHHDQNDHINDDDDNDDDDRLVPKNCPSESSHDNSNRLAAALATNMQGISGSVGLGVGAISIGINENEEDCIMNEQQYNRLRRMLANKENEERARFRRQDYKVSNVNEYGILPGNLFNYINKRPSPLSAMTAIVDDSTIDVAMLNVPQKEQHTHLSKPQQQQSSLESQQQPQHVKGRNISAMLDDNNTVRCFLEPLQK